MLLNKNLNTVWLSEILCIDKRYNSSYEALTAMLDKYNISHKKIKGTKDIWCRDYMPLQTAKGKLVQFKYEPSYLVGYEKLKTLPQEVCTKNQLDVIFSNINLDGGNVVSWSDKALITDRIFTENPEFADKLKLVSEIEKLLDVEVIIIPQIKSDMTGHADGLLRFVNSDTIVGNDRTREYKNWVKSIEQVLAKYNLNYIDVPFLDCKIKGKPHHAIGCYLNYLEVGNLIVLPVFEVEGNRDEEVKDMFINLFPDRIIETLNYNEIGYEGGLLNCTTWSTFE